MYTFFFLILALASALWGWGGDSLTAKLLFSLFAVLYLISLAFDICERREAALDDEEEDDAYSVRHYFD